MKEKTKKTVRLVYGSVLAVMTAVVGVMFIWQTLDIYLTGTAADYTGKFVYTTERVGERLSLIAPAFWIWIVLIVGGAVVWEVFSVKDKTVPYTDPNYTLMRLKKRFPQSPKEELKESIEFIKKQEFTLICLRSGLAVAVLVCAVCGIVYLADPTHFPYEDVTGEVLKMAAYLLPFAIALYLVACAAAFYSRRSAQKQLPYAKKLAAGNRPEKSSRGAIYSILHHKYFAYGVRICIGCIGVAFIIAGVCNGNMGNILIKAINICTECIGLG